MPFSYFPFLVSPAGMQAARVSHGDWSWVWQGEVASHHGDPLLATVPGRRSGSLRYPSGGGLGVSPSARCWMPEDLGV